MWFMDGANPIIVLILIYVALDFAFEMGGLVVETIAEKLKKCFKRFRDDRKPRVSSS